MANLSPKAKDRLLSWLHDKGYGSEQDGVFYPVTQLSIGMMMDFLDIRPGNVIPVRDVKNMNEPCDVLFECVKEILEQKN